MRRGFSTDDQRALPVDIYASSVDALYADSRSLYAGTISAAAAAAVTAWKAAQWPFLACSLLLALIGWARVRDMAAYSRQKPSADNYVETRRWEKRYILGSGAFVAILSFWCFLTFALTSDPAVHLISFSVSLAYLVGVTGRNFSSDQLVTTQTVCAGLPMTAGLIIQNDIYYAFLASLLIPFFLSLRFISTRLRKTLFDAVVASREIQLLAKRFDTALNNMPHGLCMFDANRRLLVTNHRFIEMLGLGSNLNGNLCIRELLQHITASNQLRHLSPDEFASQFEERIASRQRQTLALEVDANKTFELTFQPMENGGHVVLSEDITERQQTAERIEHLARYDALTGLPNRTHLEDEFERLTAQGMQSCALLFIDLDQFKKVNDTLGHPAGDALLCQVANRLRRILNTTGIVARFGGDEFVVLLPIQHSKDEAAQLAGHIIRTLSEIYDVNGHQIMVGASVGVGVMPEDGRTFEQILKCADMAMYHAKADGRGTYSFFEHTMDEKAQARRALELDIRNAMTRNEFDIYFQPIVDIKTGRTVTCEALLRWPHTERGMVPPNEFVSVVEEMGLITELGTWVLHKACSECTTWPKNIGVAVNVSAIQFRRSNVSELIAECLASTGLSADRLEIEITESVLLENTAEIQKALNDIRKQGVRISLDDFGTGYSSLSYLREFPLSKIKIDRSFLAGIENDPRSMKLLYGIARVSADLGMSVVVEGVETHRQLTLLLQEPSITQVQGYLFSGAIGGVDTHKRLKDERALECIA
ncbi:EAL domain-containing protein [Afipia carboxidovorans]|nr:EAL domain-containing protein [Afipia carboxidovorans]